MRSWVLWVLVGMGVSCPARAERLLAPNAIVRGAAEASHLKKLVTSPADWAATFALAAPAPAPAPGRIDLRNAFGKILITRDLTLPGLSFLALRLIPTRRALGGDGRSPVVIRPRVVAADWYGLDVTARF
jgi:hypothetical protein